MNLTSELTPPASNEIEVSIFSRGYGESACVHVGEGTWLIIDSLIGEDGHASPLRYLRQIGVPFDAVTTVLLTHWHDDHVKGAAQIVEACEKARVAITGVLQRDEFKAFLRQAQTSESEGFTSGVDELLSILKLLRAREQMPRYCWSERKISGATRPTYDFEALSPSDADYHQMLLALQKWSEPTDTARRLPSPPRNDASVASVIEVADQLLLFGADLEVTRPSTGWHEVHGVAWRNRGKASFFKIAHHGSPNGDYPPVWEDLLVPNVQAALTPWSRGRKLPTQADVKRILSHTENAHAASKVRSRRPHWRLSTVEKSLREAHISVYRNPENTGHVRLRKCLGGEWDIAYVQGDSCPLSDLLAA